MRYFFILFTVAIVAVVAIAGKRGSRSRRPPIEVFPDMDRQLAAAAAAERIFHEPAQLATARAGHRGALGPDSNPGRAGVAVRGRAGQYRARDGHDQFY